MGQSLSKRPCNLGKLNPRSETHGDDLVPALDINLTGIMLDTDELNLLLGDEYAHRALFKTSGRVHEPNLKALVPKFAVRDSFEKSFVTFVVGMNEDKIKLDQVKLRRLVITPCTGGLTELSIQVQSHADAAQLGTLYVWQDKRVDVSIRFGKTEARTKDQPELPMGKAGDDDESAQQQLQ